MSVVTPGQSHVNAVTQTPESIDELVQAKSSLKRPSSEAFTIAKLTCDQQASGLDLCARYRPVLALYMAELGRCTNAEACPLPPDTRPVDRAPRRANPRAEFVVNKSIHDMLQ